MLARKIHAKAEIAREKGDFLMSLKILDEAVIAYQKESDYLGLSEAMSSRFLTYKHLFLFSKDASYQILAKHAIEAAVEIAEKQSDRSACALPYYNIAQFYDEFENDYKRAIEYYNKAIKILENDPPEEHKVQMPGLVNTIKVHLHAAEYKNGDKSAVDRLLEANEKISEHKHKYKRDVWMSGGYMKLAELLKRDGPEKSQTCLQKAKEIIDSNPDLTIRARQWKELAENLRN